MYRPTAFAEDDLDVVLDMIDQASLAHLVVHTSDGFESSPLPILADVRDGIVHLRGHLARPNPLWRLAPCDAFVIVALSDAYISPSWYPSKAVNGKVVPTWNYEVVHAHGKLVAHDDVEWLERLVRDLTERHERANAEPWAVDDAPRRLRRRDAPRDRRRRGRGRAHRGQAQAEPEPLGGGPARRRRRPRRGRGATVGRVSPRRCGGS